MITPRRYFVKLDNFDKSRLFNKVSFVVEAQSATEAIGEIADRIPNGSDDFSIHVERVNELVNINLCACDTKKKKAF